MSDSQSVLSRMVNPIMKMGAIQAMEMEGLILLGLMPMIKAIYNNMNNATYTVIY